MGRHRDFKYIEYTEWPKEERCRVCGLVLPISKFRNHYNRFLKGSIDKDKGTVSLYPVCGDCRWKRSSVYLGITVAEKVLSNVFKNVKRMPRFNKGFDFICNKGLKVDVKSACMRYDGSWGFTLNYNTTADYFACLAFDNRKSLKPLHFWLIPGDVINKKYSLHIGSKSLDKWKEYERPIDKVLTSCNLMKSKLSYFMSIPEAKKKR